MVYSIIIEKDEKCGLYIGQCCEIPMALSQGKTIKELMANMKEAVELAIEVQKEETTEKYIGKKVQKRKLVV